MPRIGKERISYQDGNRVSMLSAPFEMFVSVDGIFSCVVPEKLAKQSTREDREKFRIRGVSSSSAAGDRDGSPTLEELRGWLSLLLHRSTLPDAVTVEHIIRYNVESHVSFALDGEGNIFPNAGFPGASWPPRVSHKFGNKDSSHPSEGGYSLTAGAKALEKTTRTFAGGRIEHSYAMWYGPSGDHWNREHPASLLNTWVCFSLPEDADEMPYSDEAARFFFDLMKGMAALQLRIQAVFKNPQTLQERIASGARLLGGGA